ncbi:MAG TPA: hypothetical protein VLK85_13025 [Ramlibacter sp.]|nr:hypothetical protein [Ramlibacter sp.]
MNLSTSPLDESLSLRQILSAQGAESSTARDQRLELARQARRGPRMRGITAIYLDVEVIELTMPADEPGEA